jgi:hypothetical protein
MKKLVFRGSFIALVGIGLIGCEKEAITQHGKVNNSINKNEVNYFSNDTLLVFRTVEDYEVAITDITNEEEIDFVTRIKELSYTSYSEHLENEGGQAEDLIGDNVLNTILNKDWVVQIGNYLYRVNMQLDKVFVLPVTHASYYNDLVSQNLENKNIRQFSTGEDVVYLAESGDPGEKCGGIDGGTYRCYAQSYQGQIIKTFSNGSVWRLNPFVGFFRAGVYFKLSSQFEVYRYLSASSETNGQVVDDISGNDVTIEMFVRGPQGWWKKRPCNSGSTGTINSGFHYSQSINGKDKKTVYSGTRNLNGYYFFVQGRAKYPDGSATIASPYGGRNINSPY